MEFDMRVGHVGGGAPLPIVVSFSVPTELKQVLALGPLGNQFVSVYESETQYCARLQVS